jgi:hypothetical protein
MKMSLAKFRKIFKGNVEVTKPNPPKPTESKPQDNKDNTKDTPYTK